MNKQQNEVFENLHKISNLQSIKLFDCFMSLTGKFPFLTLPCPRFLSRKYFGFKKILMTNLPLKINWYQVGML